MYHPNESVLSSVKKMLPEHVEWETSTAEKPTAVPRVH